MISLKKRNQGFTIVELLIVIVVIGILALIVVTTYSGIQQKARNSKRQADLTSLQTQLEAFVNDKGYYPSLTDMNSASWRASNMKGLDNAAIKDPQSTEISFQPRLNASWIDTLATRAVKQPTLTVHNTPS